MIWGKDKKETKEKLNYCNIIKKYGQGGDHEILRCLDTHQNKI
jgi:hypothetical protein